MAKKKPIDMTPDEKQARIEAIRASIEQLKAKKLKHLKAAEKYKNENKIEFFLTPNPPQKKLMDAWEDMSYKVFGYGGGNRSGKTTIAVILGLSTIFGEYLWNKQRPAFPAHNMPRKVRLIGQDWEKHIKTVLEPKLDEWWPKSRKVETKKNNVGARHMWTDVKTGSTLEIMSNMSESDVAEGWDGDLVMYDEPPDRAMRVACARGLVDRNGRELFSMTLLKQPWISREIMRAVDEKGIPDRSVFWVNASIYDNIGFGLTWEGVTQFEKTLTEAEKQARLLGIPSYMSSIIWPIDRQMHIKKRFKVPLDWMVSVEIDFHPSKPWAINFLATDPRNFHYVVEEIWEHGNPKYIAEEIVRKIKGNHYRCVSIEIDPLAKGDSNNEETVYEIMRRVLASHGFMLRTASKDKDNGISIVRDWLMTENEMPALFIFEDCKKTIEQIENWTTDPETLKPSKEEDDMCECLYRHALRTRPWYEDEEEETYQPPQPKLANSVTGY